MGKTMGWKNGLISNLGMPDYRKYLVNDVLGEAEHCAVIGQLKTKMYWPTGQLDFFLPCLVSDLLLNVMMYRHFNEISSLLHFRHLWSCTSWLGKWAKIATICYGGQQLVWLINIFMKRLTGILLLK